MRNCGTQLHARTAPAAGDERVEQDANSCRGRHPSVSAALSPFRSELKGIRLSYTGEEMGTCHVLTRDQVLPALPPGEHGASVDVMELLSPRYPKTSS